MHTSQNFIFSFHNLVLLFWFLSNRGVSYAVLNVDGAARKRAYWKLFLRVSVPVWVSPLMLCLLWCRVVFWRWLELMIYLFLVFVLAICMGLLWRHFEVFIITLAWKNGNVHDSSSCPKFLQLCCLLSCLDGTLFRRIQRVWWFSAFDSEGNIGDVIPRSTQYIY